MTDLGIQLWKRPRMVYSTSQRQILSFLAGHCGMEIAVLLLLIVPLTTASPLILPQRSDDIDVALPGATVEAVGVQKSEGMQDSHTSFVKIVPFHSEDKQLDLDALKHRMALKLRPRRAPQRGCQLGTCQLHNLANTLYHISKTSDKEESKKAKDPQGYGR